MSWTEMDPEGQVVFVVAIALMVLVFLGVGVYLFRGFRSAEERREGRNQDSE